MKSMFVLLLSVALALLPSLASASTTRHATKISPTATASAPKRYAPSWADLDTRPLPDWFDDAKFGIFIHFGVFSVPSWSPVGTYAEWYWNNLSQTPGDDVALAIQAHHNATYGPNFRYQDFAPMFKAELFNATEWIELFQRAGARYTVPTSKHHEGFTMWPSPTSWNWNSVDVGPHRNVLKEVMDASRSAGLHAGVYFSLYEWYHPLYLSNATQYANDVMYPQWLELINDYQPDLLWCDGDWEQSDKLWRSEEFLAYVFNDSPVKDKIVVNDRFGSGDADHHGSFYTPEYDTKVFADKKWEANLGIDTHSYGLNRKTHADQYLTSEYLLNYLVRSVSNGGNMLLNVGPNADGTIPAIMQQRLLDMGAWLDVNGEGIYGTQKFKYQQEGSIDNTTVRYTQRKDGAAIFAFIIDWPETGTLNLKSVKPGADAAITMMGRPGSISFKVAAGGGIVVTLPQLNPSHMPCDYIWTLRLVNFAAA